MLFLGLASNYSAKDIFNHAFALGSKKDYSELEENLAKRYASDVERTTLLYSGRTAIYLALKSFIEAGQVKKNDHVAINAFTCRAVVEAIQKAALEPVYIDIEKESPDYTPESLEKALKNDYKIKVFILQNTFGVPVDIKSFEKIKQKHNLLLIEDLAHSAGRKYLDGREIGTVGDAACLSFGKGKAIDVIIGGALILRNNFTFPKTFKKLDLEKPRIPDSMRAGWYPIFGSLARGLAHIRLEKPFLALLLKLKWIEKSADTKLDSSRTITYWQAKLVKAKIKHLKNKPLREYILVKNRKDCLEELKKAGFRLEEFWYEVPIAPERYYKKLNFPEKTCKNAKWFSEHVINLPTWYNDKKHLKEIKSAIKIINKYKVRG